MQNLSNMKSTLIAAYGEPDRISVATSGNLMGMSLSNLHHRRSCRTPFPSRNSWEHRGAQPAFK